MALIDIPEEFGKGGANLSEGDVTLKEILQNLHDEIEDLETGSVDPTARAAALAAQGDADTAQSTAADAAAAAAAAQLTADAALVAAGPQMTSANLANADATIMVSQGTHRTLPAATLTTDRTIVIDPTGMETDEVIQITRLDATAHTLTITNGGVGGGNPYVFAASLKRTVSFRFDGTDIKRAGIARIA